MGLGLTILPDHTSHVMQPLDVNVFKLFKKVSRRYQDELGFLEIGNKGEGVAQRTQPNGFLLALKKKNLGGHYRKILHYQHMVAKQRGNDGKLGPNEAFVNILNDNIQEFLFDINVEN